MGELALNEEQSRHALASLRLRPGESATIFDGRGSVARGVLQAPPGQPATRGKHARARPAAVFDVAGIEHVPPPERKLTLIVAGCKGPRLSWMIEKCTELGVTRMILTEFERSVVKVGKGQLEKLRRTAVEACKQCGRDWLPGIVTARSLQSALTTKETEQLFVADPSESALDLGSLFRRKPSGAAHTAAVIGPEGGLTDNEMTELATAGARCVRLAANVLRVETAAVSLAAIWAAQAAIRD